MVLEEGLIMKINKETTELITELERLIGRECYNPNSYNGWTHEEGREFRYPVHYCKSKKDIKKHHLSSTKGKINGINVDCVNTIKYKFGSNHLYVGVGIINMINMLEQRYNIDISELEQKYIENQRNSTREIVNRMERGENILYEDGCYKVGIDIPEGKFYIRSVEEYAYVDIINTRGTIKSYLISNIKYTRIHLVSGYKLRTNRDYILSTDKI